MRTEKRIISKLWNHTKFFMFVAFLCHSTSAAEMLNYYDDFEANNAVYQSVSHSVFWPETAYPPNQPYLFFSDYLTNGQRSLVFMDFDNIAADIIYCFPLSQSDITHHSIEGYLSCNVLNPFPNYKNTSIVCRISPTGVTWNEPIRLIKGYNEIPLFSYTGMIYVQFIGKGVAIDNLSIHMETIDPDIIVPDEYNTIQDAIDNALDGQIIEVLPGIYSDIGNVNLDTKGKALTIRSATGPNDTIIYCNTQTGSRPQRGFYFHNNEKLNTIIQGFTIDNGYVINQSIPDFDQPWSKSSNYSIGGGIYCEFASPTISNCRIINSQAHIGGGIGIVGDRPEINNCIIGNCIAVNSDNSNYTALGAGIGILLDSKVRIINCTINNNKCDNLGLGCGIYGYKCSPFISKTTICDNISNLAVGGGIFFQDTNTTILKNCLLYNNSAKDGGAISIDCSQNADSGFILENCTIADNFCSVASDPNSCAIINVSNTNFYINNSIIWNKGYLQINPDIDTSAGLVEYSNILKGFPGVNNIDIDPAFASTSSATAPDYHLLSTQGRFIPINQQWVYDQSDSPCIDTGKPSKITNMEPWPNGKRSNMGFYGQTSEASKSLNYRILHVDVEKGKDSNNGQSHENAFNTITQAIRNASNNNMILIWPGIYNETINPHGKKLLIQSAAQPAVITQNSYIGLEFNHAEQYDTIIRNLIVHNCAYAIFCSNTSPRLSNLTIVNNQAGLVIQDDSVPLIDNSIFWNNRNADIFCDALGCKITYCRYNKDKIQINPADDSQVILKDNIYDLPLFSDISIDFNIYNLPSVEGHFIGFNDPNNVDLPNLWELDNMTSPCIDAGNPYINPIRETMPNGGRINIGAYGGTLYASRNAWQLIGDLDYDGIVDLYDFSIISKYWYSNSCASEEKPAEIPETNINLLLELAENWLDYVPWSTKNNESESDNIQ